MNILLVDDNDAVRMTFGALLEDDGHTVIEAETVAAARARLTDAYDLVVLDLHLPDGLGAELIPEIRAARPGAVIALMSGSATELPPGADLVVPKDCAPSALVALAIAARP